MAWQFFKYVYYVLNIITPDSFYFDFEVTAVINFIVLLGVVSLGLTIFKQKRWSLITVGVVGLLYLWVFGLTYINWLGAGIVVLLFLLARRYGVEERDQRTKINARMIVRRTVPGIIISIFILISFAAFQSPVAKGIAEAEQLPSASRQMMRTLVESVIGSQIPAGPEKESIISQVTNQTLQQINGMLKPYFQYAPPLLAFGLFLVLWGLSWFFIQLSVLVGMLMFWILKKTNFVKIEKKNIEAETLVV